MKFLIDVGVGKMVEKFLSEEKHDVKAIRNLNPKMQDFEILQLAVTEQRIVITMDKDFGELIYKSHYGHCGVLLLRAEDMNGEEKQKLVEMIVNKFGSELENNFCVFQKDNFRIRKK